MLLLFPLSVALAGGIDVDASLDEATRLVERDHPEVARDLLWQTAWDEDGRTDPRVWAALSEACVAAADHGCAVEATEQALTWSHTEDQAAVATERLAWLTDGFGTVLLSGAEGGLVAQVSLAAEPSGEAEAGWVRVLSDRLEAGVVLPERVAVPVGEVTVGGEPVRIEPGSSHTVPIDARRRALQGTELQLSSGMQVRLAGALPTMAPSLRMGVVVPVDRVLVGVRAGTAIHPELAGVLQPGASVEVGLGGRPNRALRVRQGVIAGLSALEADVILAPGVWASIGAFDRKGSRGFAMDLRAVVAPSTSLLSGGLLGWTTRIVLDLGTEL